MVASSSVTRQQYQKLACETSWRWSSSILVTSASYSHCIAFFVRKRHIRPTQLRASGPYRRPVDHTPRRYASASSESVPFKFPQHEATASIDKKQITLRVTRRLLKFVGNNVAVESYRPKKDKAIVGSQLWLRTMWSTPGQIPAVPPNASAATVGGGSDDLAASAHPLELPSEFERASVCQPSHEISFVCTLQSSQHAPMTAA